MPKVLPTWRLSRYHSETSIGVGLGCLPPLQRLVAFALHFVVEWWSLSGSNR